MARYNQIFKEEENYNKDIVVQNISKLSCV